MDEQLKHIEEKLNELAAKTDAVFQSSEKMRKYFLWTLIITAVVVVLPLLVLPLVIPAFLQSVALPVGF
ncbi:MAG: hypothetical protein Q7R73_00400 [bacterium]|nr:hypothetical protein [bacterium]